MSIGILRLEKRKKQKEENFFFGMVKTALHFFPKLWEKLAGVKDPRHPSYVTYGIVVMLAAVIIKNAAGLRSMRQMDSAFNTDKCIENVYRALGLNPKGNLPQHDTLNDLLELTEPEEIEGVRGYMMGRYRGRDRAVLVFGKALRALFEERNNKPEDR